MPEDFEFELEPPDDPRPRGGYRPGSGRPRGAKDTISWRMARLATPQIMERLIGRAMMLDSELDFRCAALILSRTWPRPRSAPLQIDITQGPSTIVAAVQQGQLSPSDAKSLLDVTRAVPGVVANGSADARKRLAERLAKTLEQRNGQNGANPSQNGHCAPDVDLPITEDELKAEIAKEVAEAVRAAVAGRNE